jgi:Asp-tRNA(Asn)/Glu-tRNA(Gln) amidotransferase C subunit
MTREKLHHLLRLAALEPPADAAAERELLRTLNAQLHFVRQVQAVEIPPGVEPLCAVRDESARGAAEAVVGLETVREALGKEVWRGKWWRRVRRARMEARAVDEPEGLAAGRQFVVDRASR